MIYFLVDDITVYIDTDVQIYRLKERGGGQNF